MAFVRQGINKPDHEPVAHGDMYALTAWPLHFIYNTDGSTKLFDVREQPGRRMDHASESEFERAVTTLREAVERRRQAVEDPPDP